MIQLKYPTNNSCDERNNRNPESLPEADAILWNVQIEAAVAGGLDPGKERDDGKVGEEEETENDQEEGERLECAGQIGALECVIVI